ncbi:MAG: M3 family oligoendopeptidase [Planctomycetota bacterium]|nr:M3 family oligoendopeptidase [Planctomycetota bacterium]
MAEEKRDGVIWDLSSYFEEFGNDEMKNFHADIAADIIRLTKMGDQLGSLADDIEGWEEYLLLSEDISARLGHLSSFVGCLTAADAANEDYSSAEASIMRLWSRMEKSEADFTKALKDCDDETFENLLGRKKLDGMQNMLKRSRKQAKFTMSLAEEKLAADLNVDGFHAWGRLYDKLTGKLEFDMEFPDGTKKRLPISQCRSLMSDADREVGRAAFECGNKAWKGVEDVCASALNAISGTRLSLYEHRGIDHFLTPALMQSQIERKTLDAMMKAIHDTIELPREIFKTKAKAMGREGIWWFEREAPLPLKDTTRFKWDEAVKMVSSSFHRAYPDFANHFDKVISNRWIESEVRPGKRPGAFCTSSSFNNEQRVFMTFNGSLSEVSTIAHEVGHAFHSELLNELRPTQQHYPMTLAETASIFGEHIFADGVYANEEIDDNARLAMLDADLSSAAVMLLDLTIRFQFEKELYEQRAQGEVGVSKLKKLMVETQRRIFGDAMLPEGEDPYFWASKLHFYITYVTFYNYPYTFGFLLARQIYNMFKQQGSSFLGRYEEFLKYSGSDTVENVASRTLGVDISDTAFWTESINSLNEHFELYKKLLAARS